MALMAARFRRFVVLAVLLPALLIVQGGTARGQSADVGDPALAAELLRAVRDARFGETIEFGPFEDVCPGARFCPVPAQPVKHMPNVDIAVIELDAMGNATRAANVLVSRDYPHGIAVRLDDAGLAGSYGASTVRWRRWDIDRYNGGTFSQHTGKQLTVKGWTDNPPLTDADDIVPGRGSAPLQFMAPYPASLFKLIVAFRVMRLVDMRQLSLGDLHTWDPTPGADAEGKGLDRQWRGEKKGRAHDAITRTIRDWMEPMITVSDNDSTRALLKLLHDRDDLPAMHAELRELGLSTLQINGTNPETGRNWQPGAIHMTSMDTARLLWLIEGGSRLWTRPNGEPVSNSLLSDASRRYLKSLLDDQGFHEALSTSNFCGAPNTRPGIPAAVPSRWINPDGTVTAGGYPYGQDVRPCNATAEVVFGHKTGLTFNYGSDAGIVRALPDRPYRRYVISFIASLGYRYVDPVFASASSYPCYAPVGAICYTQRIPALAKQIDDFLKSGSAAAPMP